MGRCPVYVFDLIYGFHKNILTLPMIKTSSVRNFPVNLSLGTGTVIEDVHILTIRT